jgi:sugar phosphate isomerase/epimerase
MRFGLCTAPENIECAERLGYDYVEFSAAAVAALSNEQFSALAATVDKSPLKVERFNVLFPPDTRLVGPEADSGKTAAYLDRVFPRVRALGGTVVVFGSGRCRALPPGAPFKRSYRQLVTAGKLIAAAAGKYGLTVAIEPLNRGETTSINTLIEGAMFEADIDSPHVGLLADLYHILKDGEPLDDIRTVGELTHTHVAVLEGRAFPTRPDQDVTAFFEALAEVGYTGTMSIEGNTENLPDDAASALHNLRSQ